MQLNLKNFKGVKQFTLDLQGENAKVYGDNATGKTTLFDAFIWVLFDKDSQNKKDFELKTLSTDGKSLSGHEHEVEAQFNVNGRNITLRKVYSEKWTKKRGSALSEFTGHTTDYFIDGVPVKLKEYKGQVDNIVQEDVFKLLTSPAYFSEQLDWKERRKLLLTICGDITDHDVIESNKVLQQLPNILNGLDIEKHRLKVAARRTEINKELDRIPIRIDEVQRSMPDTSDLNEEELQQELSFLKNQVEEKEAEVSRIKSGGEISAKEKRLREIEGELQQIKNQLQGKTLEDMSVKRQELSTIRYETENAELQIKTKQNRIASNNKAIQSSTELTDRLRKEWHEINDRIFEAHHSEDCPTCGQALPSEQVQEAHNKALEQFNLEKAQRLERIVSQGKLEASVIENIKNDNQVLEQEINKLEEHIKVHQSEIERLQENVLSLQANVKNVEADSLYIQKKKEALNIEESIQNLRTSVQESVYKVNQEISNLKNELSALEQDLAKFAQVKVANKRIQELQDEERKLAVEFERLEHELHLTEEFIRTKVNLLTEKINSKFSQARFRLFKKNINGGLEETCTATYQGVPYDKGLNNAAKINVGLDIINTLSEHYGVSAPIFVDNSEAVTKLIDVNSQVISLVVSEADKKLRVEYGQMEEAI
ncbi:AAA family ATPase [Fictibacillus sp. JL2B1089]|uniref:AAA family ATPase n=1 Tax=Fictibacillus sp. JL2B1089 TaxID=3399565 RepID=UPI003A89C9DB